ncbi:MAG: hypothetical protein V1493_01425 [Candidatus Diapherotrites archaeon]
MQKEAILFFILIAFSLFSIAFGAFWFIFQAVEQGGLAIFDSGTLQSGEKCVDSDNGKNFDLKGATYNSGTGITQTDYCSGDLLIEWFCAGNSEASTAHKCQTVCENGACIAETGGGNGTGLGDSAENAAANCTAQFSDPKGQAGCLSRIYQLYAREPDSGESQYLGPVCEKLMEIVWANRDTISKQDGGGTVYTQYYDVPNCYALKIYSANGGDLDCGLLAGKNIDLGGGRLYDWNKECRKSLAKLVGQNADMEKSGSETIKECENRVSEEEALAACLSMAFDNYKKSLEAGGNAPPDFWQLCEKMDALVWKHRETITRTAWGEEYYYFYSVPDCYAYYAFDHNIGSSACESLSGKIVSTATFRAVDWGKRCSQTLLSLTGAEAACTDSDGGLNYYTKGYILNAEGVKSWDECNPGLDTSKNTLLEYYCTGNQAEPALGKTFECQNGCDDGACLKEGAPLIKKTTLDPPSIKHNETLRIWVDGNNFNEMKVEIFHSGTGEEENNGGSQPIATGYFGKTFTSEKAFLVWNNVADNPDRPEAGEYTVKITARNGSQETSKEAHFTIQEEELPELQTEAYILTDKDSCKAPCTVKYTCDASKISANMLSRQFDIGEKHSVPAEGEYLFEKAGDYNMVVKFYNIQPGERHATTTKTIRVT